MVIQSNELTDYMICPKCKGDNIKKKRHDLVNLIVGLSAAALTAGIAELAGAEEIASGIAIGGVFAGAACYLTNFPFKLEYGKAKSYQCNECKTQFSGLGLKGNRTDLILTTNPAEYGPECLVMEVPHR